MFDLKYHVATIVAVFLALAVGIVIGNAIVDDGFILNEQEQLIERLEKDFEFLRKQNQLVKLEIEKVKQSNKELINFTDSIFPYMINNKLNGYNIMVIKTNEASNNNLSVIDALKKAGACVKEIIISSNKLMEDERITKELLSDMAVSLGKKILGENVFLKYDYKDCITFSGSQNNSFDTVLIIGNNSEISSIIVENFEVPLIKYFKNNGYNVIASEYAEAKYSKISHYSKLNITTIDNLDTVLGQIALIMILEKNIEEPIRYGIKSTAQKLLP